VEPLVDHVQAVQQFPQSRTRQELQRFLGMINFYRRFLPAAALVLKPLMDALSGGGGKNKALSWREEMVAAFQAAKDLLCKSTCLAHPDPAAAISLVVDTSASHVGAVLQQQDQQSWRPLAFYSCKLDAAQKKYSAFDRAAGRILGGQTFSFSSRVAAVHHLFRPQAFVFRNV
jgi:RNase H-like domain found in reverse transcriptase